MRQYQRSGWRDDGSGDMKKKKDLIRVRAREVEIG